MVLNDANKNNSISLAVLDSVFTVSSYFPDNPRIRHNLYKWGLDTRGGAMFYRQKKNGGGSAYNT